jgi:hypothetical protein
MNPHTHNPNAPVSNENGGRIREVPVEGWLLGVQQQLRRLADIAPGAALNLAVNTAVERMLVSLTTYVTASSHPAQIAEVSYPASWWDAFRIRWFPFWVRRRWPPKWHIEHVTTRGPIYLCPHSTEAWPNAKHLLFLLEGNTSSELSKRIWDIAFHLQEEARHCEALLLRYAVRTPKPAPLDVPEPLDVRAKTFRQCANEIFLLVEDLHVHLERGGGDGDDLG